MSTMPIAVEDIKQSILNVAKNMLEKTACAAQNGRPLHEFEKDLFVEALKIGKLCVDSLLLQAGTGDVGKQLELSVNIRPTHIANTPKVCVSTCLHFHYLV